MKIEEENTQEVQMSEEEQEKLEKKFFLVYNLKLQPSEVDKLSETHIDFFIGRFLHQKQMEQKMMEEMKRKHVGTAPVDFIKELQRTKQ